MAVSESKKALLAARRAAGLCVQCGADAAGKSKCGPCAVKDKDARTARREARRKAGLCTECGKPAKEDCSLCQECIDKSSQCSTNRYQRNKAAGVCRYCGEPSDGKARCDTCAAKTQGYQRDWYERMKAEGNCVHCGEPTNDPAHSVCAVCRDHRSEVGRARWQRLKLDAFNAYGGPQCVGCPENDVDVLELDHVDGGGNQHRAEIGQSNLYLWLKQQGYPEGFRVLCPTCNKKAHLGKL